MKIKLQDECQILTFISFLAGVSKGNTKLTRYQLVEGWAEASCKYLCLEFKGNHFRYEGENIPLPEWVVYFLLNTEPQDSQLPYAHQMARMNAIASSIACIKE